MVTVRQQVPLGLGHAIWCARAFIGDDPFADPAAGRPRAGRHAVPAPARRCVSRHRRQRRRGDRGAARADQPLRHPAHRQGRWAAGRGAGPGGEAGAEGRAVEPVHHRPLCADAGGDRPPGAHGARRRRRGAAHRRHGEADRSSSRSMACATRAKDSTAATRSASWRRRSPTR